MKKRSLFALGAALLFAAAVSAQSQGPRPATGSGPRPAGAPGPRNAQQGAPQQKSPAEIAQAETDRAKVLLQLTDDQSKKLNDINLRYAQLGQDMRDAVRKSFEAARMREENKKKDIEAVLTPAQKATADALLAQRRSGRGRPQGGPQQGQGQMHGRPGMGAPGMMEHGAPWMGSHREMRRSGGMAVSGEVFAQMRAEKLQTVLQLSADQTKKVRDIELKYFNQAKADREAAMQAMKDNATKMRGRQGEVEAILTPAQQAAFAVISREESERMMRSHSGRGGFGSDRPSGRSFHRSGQSSQSCQCAAGCQCAGNSPAAPSGGTPSGTK